MSELHGTYDPLQYPLLFPYGEYGWHEHILRANEEDSDTMDVDDDDDDEPSQYTGATQAMQDLLLGSSRTSSKGKGRAIETESEPKKMMMMNLNLIKMMVMMQKINKLARKENGLPLKNLQFIEFKLEILLKQPVLYTFQDDYFNSIWLINLPNGSQINLDGIEIISKNLDMKQ